MDNELLVREIIACEIMPRVYAAYVEAILVAPTVEEAAATVRRAVAASTRTCRWFPRLLPSPWMHLLVPFVRAVTRIEGIETIHPSPDVLSDDLRRYSVTRQFPRVRWIGVHNGIWSHFQKTGDKFYQLYQDKECVWKHLTAPMLLYVSGADATKVEDIKNDHFSPASLPWIIDMAVVDSVFQ